MIRRATALAALVTAAAGPEAIPQRELRVRTTSWHEVRVYAYLSWQDDCSFNPPPRISVDRPPEHGTVTTRAELTELRDVRNSDDTCIGAQGLGTALYYQADPGYVGSDSFSYTVTSVRSRYRDVAVAEVLEPDDPRLDEQLRGPAARR